MAWNPLTGRFPLSGDQITMSQIRTAFNTAGDSIPVSYSLSSLVGKTLYNTDGTSYVIPPRPLAMSYFYGRWFMNPGPIIGTTRIYAGETIVIPAAPTRPIPKSFIVTVVGGAGGGGGGGGGYDCSGFGDTKRGGAGGGGGGGQVVTGTFLYTIGLALSVSGGAGGNGGSGAGKCGCTQTAGTGSAGTAGTLTRFLYGTTALDALPGQGGAGGGGAGYEPLFTLSSFEGPGGAGGAGGGGSGNGGNGDGLNGGARGQNAPLGNGGGIGGNSQNGGDGLGGAANNGDRGNIYITWYFV